MKKIVWLAVLALGMFGMSQQASAQFTPPNPFSCGQGSPLFQRLFVKQPLPAFQAAPWYLYWPYNAHFMTPAPLGLNAPWYGPPGMGGYGGYGAPGYGGGNPYFPAPGTTPPIK